MSYTPKLYLETTVFNFYFAEKEGKKKEDTHKLFKAINRGKYEVFTSKYVLDEISADNPQKYRKMKDLIDRYVQHTLYFNEEVLNLADIYVKNDIIPVKFITDARHIATATVNKLDFVVSFNMGHIVKPKTMIGTGFANLHHGRRQIGLCTPTEVIDYDYN
jgi:predicted nucleic acid-binding protein